MINQIALQLNSLLLGVMLSFIFVTSPSVFKSLDKLYAQKFLRTLFPRLFICCSIISAGITILFAFDKNFFGTVIGFINTAGFLFNNFYLTPKINLKRDLSLTEDLTAEKSFKRLHLFSVSLYVMTIVLSICLIFLFF